MNGRAIRTGKQSVGTIGRLARRLSNIRLLRSPTTKYVALAVAAAVIMIAALSPLASVIVEGWLRRDVELRARLVFRSIRDQVAA
jgi:trehalose 6-phosphate synthase